MGSMCRKYLFGMRRETKTLNDALLDLFSSTLYGSHGSYTHTGAAVHASLSS